jgi:hypothetical protein
VGPWVDKGMELVDLSLVDLKKGCLYSLKVLFEFPLYRWMIEKLNKTVVVGVID